MNVVKASAGREEGFSLLAVLIISLVMIIASVAAIQRSGNGLFGSLFNTQSKEARETAESGITEIIGTLNQRNNRGLLLSGVSPASWGTMNNPVLQNPCNDEVDDPSATAAAIGSTGTKPAGGETDQRYYVKSISFTSVDGATGARSTRTFSRANSAAATFTPDPPLDTPAFKPNDISLNGDRKGYFELVVVGQVLRAGTVIASAEVKREFQVVPKCCDLSFGNTYANPASPTPDHGLDQRSCKSDWSLSLNPLVVGAGGDGIFGSNGNSLTLYRPDSSNPLETIGTLNYSDPDNPDLPNDCEPVSDCQVSWGGNTTLIKPLNNELPPLPPAPTTVTKSGCISNNVTLPYNGLASSSRYAKPADFSPSGNCTSSTVNVNETVYQFQKNTSTATKTKVGSAWQTVYTCSAGLTLGDDLPGGAITVDSRLQNITLNPTECYSVTQRTVAQNVGDPFCAYNSSESRFDCLIRYIEGNINVKVDSTEFPVRIYLYDAEGTSPVTGGTVSFTGNGGIAHVKCTTYSPTCSTPALLADASSFQVYGNVDEQNIDLRGNTDALAGTFYFPFANVELRGGGGVLNFSGILWVNNLNLRGGVVFSIPSINDARTILCGVYLNLCDNDPTNDNVRPRYDFVARSVSSTSLFN